MNPGDTAARAVWEGCARKRRGGSLSVNLHKTSLSCVPFLSLRAAICALAHGTFYHFAHPADALSQRLLWVFGTTGRP
jgi:hypothetical protein